MKSEVKVKVKFIRYLLIFIVILVFLWWASKAILRFTREPISTKTYSTYGENEKVNKFETPPYINGP